MVTFAVSPVARKTFGGRVSPETPVRAMAELGADDVVHASPTILPSCAAPNGFVHGVMLAYNGHHDLIIRPDDIWAAIMIQFGRYVNGAPDDVKSTIIHSGSSTDLVLTIPGDNVANYDEIAANLVQRMQSILVDPASLEWMLPSFTTTTPHDTIIGSIAMLASMNEPVCSMPTMQCGIPHVTLLGSVADWMDIRARVERFAALGLPGWAKMLHSTLDKFVAATEGCVDEAFWQHMVLDGDASDARYVSGWICVFCVFANDGAWQCAKGWTSIETTPEDEDQYPTLRLDQVPAGYVVVDVKLEDESSCYDTVLLAGHMAYGVQDGATIVPQLGWAIVFQNALNETDAALITETPDAQRSQTEVLDEMTPTSECDESDDGDAPCSQVAATITSSHDAHLELPQPSLPLSSWAVVLVQVLVVVVAISITAGVRWSHAN
ncbi:hypothetical protein SDRG_16580 [Saprolegnia diclina VS20]|uniref:Uncharacterized protein n=1 Tax=Saprolegnia diclina (strain VS20) TaxID=1156394 RepID=T0R7U3_SAPDV|nr:hypothetical protein SDRG_16580 [Saprolegnia diclina VS20]EQC25562.1 hypothetical protein SDRG_16580 [Saprolegnia diclina VS20]|eukprot:XP_008621018.1 hypothetical protein SDRG_16580 [Saprolegnia diclina VS20]